MLAFWLPAPAQPATPVAFSERTSASRFRKSAAIDCSAGSVPGSHAWGKRADARPSFCEILELAATPNQQYGTRLQDLPGRA